MRKLPHDLRAERRRAGLSQFDIAHLLGRHVSKVSRYEQLRRLPNLETALAYEVILGKPVAILFRGTYGRIFQTVVRRARRLQRRAGTSTRDGSFALRKRSISAIFS